MAKKYNENWQTREIGQASREIFGKTIRQKDSRQPDKLVGRREEKSFRRYRVKHVK